MCFGLGSEASSAKDLTSDEGEVFVLSAGLIRAVIIFEIRQRGLAVHQTLLTAVSPGRQVSKRVSHTSPCNN
jgi:hypothetical protein